MILRKYIYLRKQSPKLVPLYLKKKAVEGIKFLQVGKICKLWMRGLGNYWCDIGGPSPFGMSFLFATPLLFTTDLTPRPLCSPPTSLLHYKCPLCDNSYFRPSVTDFLIKTHTFILLYLISPSSHIRTYFNNNFLKSCS